MSLTSPDPARESGRRDRRQRDAIAAYLRVLHRLLKRSIVAEMPHTIGIGGPVFVTIDEAPHDRRFVDLVRVLKPRCASSRIR